MGMGLSATEQLWSWLWLLQLPAQRQGWCRAMQCSWWLVQQLQHCWAAEESTAQGRGVQWVCEQQAVFPVGGVCCWLALVGSVIHIHPVLRPNTTMHSDTSNPFAGHDSWAATTHGAPSRPHGPPLGSHGGAPWRSHGPPLRPHGAPRRPSAGPLWRPSAAAADAAAAPSGRLHAAGWAATASWGYGRHDGWAPWWRHDDGWATRPWDAAPYGSAWHGAASSWR
jgi:hypothetical protein